MLAGCNEWQGWRQDWTVPLAIENLISRASLGHRLERVRDSYFCLRLYSAALSVLIEAGFSLFCILNIETGDPPAGWGVRRTISNKEFRTAEVLKKIRQCLSLRYSAVPCSAVLRFIFSNDVLLRVFPRHRYATLGYNWSIDSMETTVVPSKFKLSIRMAQSLLISKGGLGFGDVRSFLQPSSASGGLW